MPEMGTTAVDEVEAIFDAYKLENKTSPLTLMQFRQVI